MTRPRSEQSIHAETARLHRPSAQATIHQWTQKKSYFYRNARHIHAWLSAFAFLALMFFASTGLLLNNPNWLASKPEEIKTQVTLPAAVLTQAKTLENPTPLLLDAIRAQTKPQTIIGVFKSSDLDNGDVKIQFRGAKGRTDINVVLATGQTDISIKPASTLDTLKNLHKGKGVGMSWKLVIDVCAILILTLSIAGYVLFFSLRKRKTISLWLTGLCLVTLVSAFIWGVV